MVRDSTLEVIRILNKTETTGSYNFPPEVRSGGWDQANIRIIKHPVSLSLTTLCRGMWRAVEEVRDAIYHEQLARVARLKADSCGDADLARRLREAAIRHERKARQMRRHGG